MSETPTIVEAIDDLIDARLSEMQVAIPGRVESYNESDQSADVQPMVQRTYLKEDGSRGTETIPVVPKVPVVFPGGGSYGVTFPLSKGDTVLLIFSQASIDKWLDSGRLSDPAFDHHHDISDGIAIPGLRSFNSATSEVSGTALVVSAPEIRIGSAVLALDSVVKGTTYRAAEDTLMAVYAAAMAALLADPGLAALLAVPAKTALGAVATAQAAFLATSATYLSTKVKVE